MINVVNWWSYVILIVAVWVFFLRYNVEASQALSWQDSRESAFNSVGIPRVGFNRTLWESCGNGIDSLRESHGIDGLCDVAAVGLMSYLLYSIHNFISSSSSSSSSSSISSSFYLFHYNNGSNEITPGLDEWTRGWDEVRYVCQHGVGDKLCGNGWG